MKIAKHAILSIFVIITLIVVYLTQCQEYSSNDYMQELAIEPEVIAFSGPVAVNDNIISFEVEFNKDMNTMTAESAMSLVRRDFEKLDALSNMAIFEWSDNKHVKISIPKLPLNTLYLYRINTSALTLYGNRPLLKPYYKDIMLSISDSDRPFVKSYNPTATSSAPINARVMATFNKPMKKESVLASFALYDSSNNLVQGGVYYDEVGKTLNFMPFSNLSTSSTYRSVITAEAKDLFQIPLAQDFTFTFSTGSNVDVTAPSVLSITDNNNGQTRYTYTPIGIWFSEQMNFNFMPSSVTVLLGTTPVVIGSYHFEADNSFWLHPSDILSANIIYTVMVNSQAVDFAGNPISNAPYIFQILLLQDTTLPIITGSEPANGMIDQVVNTIISINFNKGMDKMSVENAFNCKDNIYNVATIGTFSWQGDTVVKFTPSNQLSYNSEYLYTIGTTAKDKSGNYLQQDYRTKFTTLQQTSTSTPITLTVPTLSSGAITSTSVVLNWTTSTGADSYAIYFVQGSCSTEILYHYSNITETNSAIIESLQPNTTYSYYVKANNSKVESAYSNCCNITTSASTIINQIPVGQITSPSDGICSTSNTIVINGTANDIDGSIQLANIKVDGGNIPTSGTSNWTAIATSLSNGSHSISLTIYDNEGSASNPHIITVTVDATPISVGINSPTSSQTIESTSSLNLSGGFFNPDPCCPDRTIQYSIDGTSIWTDVSNIGANIWSHSSLSGSSFIPGAHTVMVKIFNDCSMSNTSTRYFIINTPPIAQILTPLDSSCIYNNPLIISGTTNDIGGKITSIVLKVDNTAQLTSGTTDWTGTASGLSNALHTISIMAYDNLGSPSLPHVISVAVDRTATLIRINTPTSSFYECNYSIPMSGTYSYSSCKGLNTIQFRIDSGIWNSIASINNGYWSRSPLTSGLTGSSNHSIQVMIQDNILGTNSAIYNLSTYYNQPTVNIISPTNNQTSDIILSIKLSGTYNNIDTCCSNKTIQFKIDSASLWTDVSSIGAGYWTHAPLSASAFTEGGHSVKVKFTNDCSLSNSSNVIMFNIYDFGSFGLKWITIPSGTFMMGTTSSGDYPDALNSMPIHTVQLTQFDMLETEVTIGQYIAFLNAVEWSSTDTPGTSTLGKFNNQMETSSLYCGIQRFGSSGSFSYGIVNGTWSDHPINFVTWTNACEFCQWISGTLPSEAQWEFACGGSNHYLWSLGNTFSCSSYCINLAPCTKSTTCAVKSYTANGYGLYDMSGNVYEWIYDWHSITVLGSTGTCSSTNSFYQNCLNNGTVTNPVNYYNSSLDKVIRGGSWFFGDENFFRASYREGGYPYNRTLQNGFRCVR